MTPILVGATTSPDSPEEATDTEEDDVFLLGRRRQWARLISKVWLDDPERCPRGQTKLEVVSVLVSPHKTMSSEPS